ncbi:MAG: PAS domain S-box protein, partial [Chloroflexota bacterium]
RKRAEEQLRFQADVLRNAHNSVIVTDLAGKIVYWNEGATTVFGYSAEEMLGETPALLYPDQAPALLAADLERVMEGQDYVGEWKGRRKDGAAVWIDIRTTLMRDAEGRAVGFIGVATDVTGRRRAEAALAESEKRFRVLVERSYDAIALISADGTVAYRSPTAAQISGFSPEELTGMSIFAQVHPDDLPGAKALFAQLLQEPSRSVTIELRFQHKDGSWRWLEATGANLLAEPSVRAIVANYRDITDRKQAEAERERLFEQVRESRAQSRALSRRLVEAQEAERRRIARELHDEIGQALTGLKLLLEIVAGSPDDAGAVGDRLSRAQALVEQITTQVHDLSLELRPPVLDDLGLLPALLWHFEHYTAQTNVRVTVEHRGVKDRRFAAEVETAVYRIVQEALTNAARHAGVREAVVRLWADQDTLGVQVEDRGRGFDPQAALASSGFSGMRERARLLGGQFEIESAPGAGATLTVELPLGGEPLERRERAR